MGSGMQDNSLLLLSEDVVILPSTSIIVLMDQETRLRNINSTMVRVVVEVETMVAKAVLEQVSSTRGCGAPYLVSLPRY